MSAIVKHRNKLGTNETAYTCAKCKSFFFAEPNTCPKRLCDKCAWCNPYEQRPRCGNFSTTCLYGNCVSGGEIASNDVVYAKAVAVICLGLAFGFYMGLMFK